MRKVLPLGRQEPKPPLLDDDGRPLAMELIVRIVPSPNNTAMKLRPERLTLVRAAARTDRDTKSIEMTVQVRIDAVTRSEKDIVTATTVVDKVLGIPDLHTMGDRNKEFTVISRHTPPCKDKLPGDTIVENGREAECRDLRETSWFEAIPKSPLDVKECGPANDRNAKCDGITPFTLAVSVTEAGSGADTFGAASKIIDDNKRTFNDAIRDAIKEALTKSP